MAAATATINKCLFLLAIEWWEGERATKSSRKKENRILRDRWMLSHKKFTVTFSLLNQKHMRKIMFHIESQLDGNESLSLS